MANYTQADVDNYYLEKRIKSRGREIARLDAVLRAGKRYAKEKAWRKKEGFDW
jgi:hypothetical protein